MIQEAITYIENHYNKPITREDLATRLRCSVAHFSRLFSKTTGYSYREFLLLFRLEKAKEMLERSHLKVAEIAYGAGFQDPSYFSKAFRKQVGVSPRQYRATRAGGVREPD